MKIKKIQKYFIALILVLSISISFGMGPPEELKNIPEEIEPLNAPFDMPKMERPNIPARTFNIKKFGAKKGNRTEYVDNNTETIHKAIEAAHSSGGGKVVVPEGEWWTGPTTFTYYSVKFRRF